METTTRLTIDDIAAAINSLNHDRWSDTYDPADDFTTYDEAGEPVIDHAALAAYLQTVEHGAQLRRTYRLIATPRRDKTLAPDTAIASLEARYQVVSPWLPVAAGWTAQTEQARWMALAERER